MLAPKLLVITTFLLIVATPPLVQVAVEAARASGPARCEIFTRRPTAANLRDYEKSLQNDSITARTLRPLMQATQFFVFRDAGDKALIGARRMALLSARSELPYAACPAWRLDGQGRGDRRRCAFATISRRAASGSSSCPHRTRRACIRTSLPGSPRRPSRPSATETRAFLAQANAAGVEVVDLFAHFAARAPNVVRAALSRAGQPLVARRAWRWPRPPWPGGSSSEAG